MCRAENPEDARDLVQETYLRFLATRREAINEEAYLRTVITNMFPMLWREKRARAALRPLEEALEAPADGSQDDPLVRVVDEEMRELLSKASRLLPPRLREVIELDLEGLRDAEIAERMGVDPATVRKQLLRARARLKEIVLQEARDADE